MPIRRVHSQPPQLSRFEYGPGVYEWFEAFTDAEGVYAVFGVTFDHPVEAWMYWRILSPSVAAWRDLRRCSVPEVRRYVKSRGHKAMVVRSSDPRDVDFLKMVGYMGFVNQRTEVIHTAWQEV